MPASAVPSRPGIHSLAVVAAGVNRLQHWFQWSRAADNRVDELKRSLQGLQPLEAEQQLNQRLRRLDRLFSRWEPSLDLAMVLGPLLGLLSTVLGLMKLLQKMILPFAIKQPFLLKFLKEMTVWYRFLKEINVW